MKNKGVMISLAAVLVIGILITKGIHRFVEKAPEETTGVTAARSFSEETADGQAPALTGGFSASDGGVGQAREKSADLPAGRSGGQTEEDTALDGAAAESVSPLDTAPAVAMAMAEEGEDSGKKEAAEFVSPYKKRLLDLDSQIQKNRESQTVSGTNSSAKTAAAGELKLWDSELNTIYNDILERLDKERSERLVEEQRAWLRTRDSLAMEAAKNSQGGSSESVEYTVSLTESTRQRAYELIEIYEEELAQ